MAEFAFTYGMGYNLANCYSIVEADFEDEARRLFVAARKAAGELPDSGQRWAFCYPVDDRFRAQIERYGLTQVSVDTPIRYKEAADAHADPDHYHR